MRGRQRQEQWQRLIALHEKSGQSVSVFCQERGVSAPSFYYWRQRLQQKPNVPLTFALVDTRNNVVAPAPAMIELFLVSGDRLRVPAEATCLRLVLSVLREPRP